jgi:hypothetical protein
MEGVKGGCNNENYGRRFVQMKTNDNAIHLSLDDLSVSDVDIYGLTREEALGVPELGASYGTYGSSTHCSVEQLGGGA